MTQTMLRPRILRKPLTQEQIGLLLKVSDPEWPGLIRIGLYGGGRLGEAAALTWDKVNMEGGTIRLPGRRFDAPMPPELLAFFASLDKPAAPGAPVFPTCFKMALEHPSMLSARFRRLLSQAGVAPVGFHHLRITFVFALQRVGLSSRTAARLVGYSTNYGFEHVPMESTYLKQVLSKLYQAQ